MINLNYKLVGALKKLKKFNLNVSFGLIALLTHLFLFINASAFFDNPERIREILLVFMLMQVSFYALYNNYENLLKKIPAIQGLALFFVFFGSTYLVLSLIFGKFAFSFTWFLIFSVATAVTEELIFRGILDYKLGPILSNALFAVFHWSVYSASIEKMFVAFIAGLIFYFIKELFGLPASIGVHGAWNTYVVSIS